MFSTVKSARDITAGELLPYQNHLLSEHEEQLTYCAGRGAVSKGVETPQWRDAVVGDKRKLYKEDAGEKVIETLPEMDADTQVHFDVVQSHR